MNIYLHNIFKVDKCNLIGFRPLLTVYTFWHEARYTFMYRIISNIYYGRNLKLFKDSRCSFLIVNISEFDYWNDIYKVWYGL